MLSALPELCTSAIVALNSAHEIQVKLEPRREIAAARRLRMKNRERGVVQDDVIEIDSINSGGSVQLESIVSASHMLGTIDSGQESELVMTM